jgi:hypothetical protein
MWFKLNTTFSNYLGSLDNLTNTWSITRNLTNFSTQSNVTYVTKNGSYSATFTLNANCSYVSHSVTMGGSAVTSGVSYSNGTLTVNISKVTGAVVVSAVATGTSSGGSGGTTPPVSGNNYIDITTQGTIKGSIKDSVINQSDSSSLYLLTKVQLPSNAVSVEYQAFKTGGSYGSAFADDSNTVVKFLPKTNVTTGERVTEAVPSGATYFWHMWDDPNETEKQNADAFTYIRIYTSGEPGGGNTGGGGTEGLPVRITVQTQDNNQMLDVTTGQLTSIGDNGTGAQTITVCNIPSGATTVNYQMFKTGKTYGSGFFNGSTFISGHANNTETSGTRKTLTIPSGATEFWHMYPNRAYISSGGITAPEFDYIEFA